MSDAYRNALRTTIKQLRTALPDAWRTKASGQICQRLMALEAYQKAEHVAIYCAVNGEVDLTDLWENASAQGKSCYFPALNSDRTLTFLPATEKTAFKTNQYGILEPDVARSKARSITALDMIVLPLLAFDAYGSRLGMGAGYYDRTLQDNIKATLLGVAYTFQKVHYLEPQPWDVPLDAVITQNSVFWRENP